jgi:hypothetical protein
VFDVCARVAAEDWPTGAGGMFFGILRIFLFRLHLPARWLQRLGD